MNYFPFHLGDYAAHTGHLEPMEDLAYRRLLDVYYMREGPLPADIQATAKLVRLRSCAADVESVLREFFTLTDDGWRHARCDEEIAKMQDKQAKARASGLASANARLKSQQAAVERALLSAQADAARSLPSDSTDVQLPTPTPTPTPIVKTVGGAKRRTQLPAEFYPDETGVTAIEKTGLSLAVELGKFGDHHRAKGSVMLDWQAAWRTWVSNARRFAPTVTRQTHQAKTINDLTGGLASVKEPYALAIAR